MRACVVLVFAGLLALSVAHVTIVPNVGEGGFYFAADLRVPHATEAGAVTHEVIVDIPESVQALGEAKPFPVTGFVSFVDQVAISPVSNGHGGFRTTTVERLRWVAEKVATGEGSAGLAHEHAQHFGFQVKLPCWCTLSNEPFFNPPVGTNLPALYFKVTQNVTESDGQVVLVVWGDKPTNSVPSNWGAVAKPMPVVYLEDSDYCSQCAVVASDDSVAPGSPSSPTPTNGNSFADHDHDDDDDNAVIALAVVSAVALITILGLVGLILCITFRVTPNRSSSGTMMTSFANANSQC